MFFQLDTCIINQTSLNCSITSLLQAGNPVDQSVPQCQFQGYTCSTICIVLESPSLCLLLFPAVPAVSRLQFTSFLNLQTHYVCFYILIYRSLK